MAPGNNICKEVPESQATDNDLSIVEDEFENLNISKLSGLPVAKLSVSSTNGVHELLECPVCTNSMYPPIHQVL